MVDAKIRILGDVNSAERALNTLTKSNKALENQAKATGRATVTAQKSIIDNTRAANKEIERGINALERYEQAFRSASDRSAAFGDIDSSIGAVGGLVGTASPGAQQALTVAQDLFAAREGVERLGPGIKFLGESAASSSGLVGGLATGLQGALPGLTAAGAGLAAIAAAAAPFALAMGAVVVALNEADKQAQATNEAFKAFNAVREAERRAQTLTTEQAQKALDEAKQRAAEEQQIISDNTAIYNQFYKEAQSQIPVIGDLAARFHESRGAFEDLNQSTADAKTALTETNAEIAALEKLLERGTTAENDRADAIERNAKELETAEKSLETARQQQAATLAQLEAQERSLNEAYTKGVIARSARRALEDSRRKEDEDLAAKRADEDLNRALERQQAEHQKNLLSIAKRGSDAILAARNDLASKEADAVKRVAALQEEFRREEAKAEARFAKERKRELEDYRKSRKRALEDQRADELDALIENDITSIISGRSRFRTDRRREREDFRDGRGRAREDFEEERAAAREALDLKIADIQAELAEYRFATEQKIAQIQLQTQQELALAQQTYEERLALDADERRIQQERDAEDSRIENERRQQDRSIEDAAARASHTEALGRIETQRAATNSALDQAIAKIAALQTAINSLQMPTGIAPTAGKPVPSIPSYGGYIPNSDNAKFYSDGQSPVFDNGGIVTKPTFGKLAMNRKPEAVIPLAQLPRMMSGMGIGGGGGINVTINATVGDIATASQLEAAKEELVSGFGKAITRARQQKVG